MTQSRNLKLKIFPYIVVGFMFECLLESWLLPLLMATRLAIVHIQAREAFDILHLRHLAKMLLLALILFYTFVKLISTGEERLMSWFVFTVIG